MNPERKFLTQLIHLFKTIGSTLRIRLSVWKWARVWLRASFLPEKNYLIILAVLVGILTGLGSVGFIYVLDFVAEFARGPLSSLLSAFGPAQLVLLPVIGGLLVGPIVY